MKVEPEVKVVESVRPTPEDFKAEAEHRRVLAGHAVSLLNNHIGQFGWRCISPADESWKGNPADQPDAIAELPGEIREPLVNAMANAASFLSRVFNEDLKDHR